MELPKIIAQKDALIQSRREGQQKAIDQLPNLHLYRESARFVGPHEVSVGTETLESRRIFINDGARPSIPAIPDLESVPHLTNEFILDLKILPKHLIVSGRVGMNEKETRAMGPPLKIGKIPMTQVARAIGRDETAGLMKLIVNARNDPILGATVVASNGGELVHTL